MKSINLRDANCKKTVALLDHYLSNELTTESTVEVVAHLENCPQCVMAFKLRERVKLRLQQTFAKEVVPAKFRKRLDRAIRKERLSWFTRNFD